MSYHIGLKVLRAKVRGFQAAGSTISSRITKSEKERKNRLWNEKRALGAHCRAHLVAYGLLRGVPYSQIERCAPNNKLNPQTVLDIILAHHRPTLDEWVQGQSFDLERVKQLLGDAPPASNETGNGQASPTAVPVSDAPKSSGVARVVKSLLGFVGRSPTAPENAR